MNDDELWSAMRARLAVGQVVAGRVCRHAPYGVFVDLNLPFEGLIQITDFKDHGVMSPREFPPVGARLEAVVLGFKETGHQIWLGVKPSQLAGKPGIGRGHAIQGDGSSSAP